MHTPLAELNSLPRWINFQLTPGPDGRLGKRPVDVNTGGFASCDQPATWASYDDAVAYAAANPGHEKGFALDKAVGLVIVDFDKVRADESAPWPSWVLDEVENLDSYTEVSSSGRGLHVLCWGAIPRNVNRQNCNTELWDSSKMFALTGNILDGRSEIKDRKDYLLRLHKRVEAGEIGPNRVIVAEAFNREKFEDYLAGNYSKHGQGRSEAVQSVLWTLARQTQFNPEEMRRIFELSPL
jgi:primase-polymerase (primpol)-like protein